MTLRTISLAALAAGLCFGGQAVAQTAQPSAPPTADPVASQAADATPEKPAVGVAKTPEGDEIIVTARKRDETLISVPVVVSAIPAAELQRRAIVSLDDVARVVPQLMIGAQGGSVQGGNVSIRGISGPDQNPFGDQAVSFNVDGVQVAKSTIRRLATTDVSQLEVLKGPQALFFGKNSPAGIVSIRTNDPGSKFEAGGTVGYEFYAHEIRAEGYVSSPLTDTLGVRVAGFVSHMRGYLNDQTAPGSAYYNTAHDPNDTEYALRGTVKYTPSSDFTARLKLNYGRIDQNGPSATTEYISCPDGVRQNREVVTALGLAPGSLTACAPGRNAGSNPGYGTVVASIPATLNYYRPDGQNFLTQKQLLSSLELNYNLTDQIALTSVTGYYKADMTECQNYENDDSIILPSCSIIHDKEFSQELRFSTNYDGPLNFIGGLYYSHTNIQSGAFTWLFAGSGSLFGVPGFATPQNPAQLNNYLLRQKGTAYSAYLQMVFKPIDVIEIDIGGRYSYEKKHLTSIRSGGGLQDGTPTDELILDSSTEVPTSIIPIRKVAFNDFSPEATISYRPTSHMTFFGSFKHGFLSGGFNSGSATFYAPPGQTIDLTYKPETIKGFEVGFKTELLDNKLRFNIAAYTYKVKNLQVSNVFNSTNTISNAGASKIKGVEADFNYHTPLQGLSIHGAVAYNDAKYTSYPNAPCYGGETAAEGCNPASNSQNLAGTPVVRAPKVNASGGADYEVPITESLKFGLSGDAMYSSSYLTDASSAPNGRMPHYTMIDANIRIGAIDDRWTLSVVGQNLTDKYVWVASSLVPFSVSSVGNLSDRFATVGRGRQVMLRASFKY